VENFTLSKVELTFFIGYEADGKFNEEKIVLSNGKSSSIKGASSLAYIRLGKKDLCVFSGKLLVSFKNHFTGQVLSGAKMIDLNQPPSDTWIIEKGMFADLYFPQPIKLFFVGWIEKRESERLRDNYPSYAHPLDNVSKEQNQLGNTDQNGLLFVRSCCFVYPNVFRGGLHNKNFYVLTRDLNLMKDLSKAL
jgi:hypothetical protein